MNLDLKKSTKKREKETFEHLLTVLMCIFGQIEREKSSLDEPKRKYEARMKRQDKLYEEARNYLGSYIEGLISTYTK